MLFFCWHALFTDHDFGLSVYYSMISPSHLLYSIYYISYDIHYRNKASMTAVAVCRRRACGFISSKRLMMGTMPEDGKGVNGWFRRFTTHIQQNYLFVLFFSSSFFRFHFIFPVFYLKLALDYPGTHQPPSIIQFCLEIWRYYGIIPGTRPEIRGKKRNIFIFFLAMLMLPLLPILLSLCK